MKNPYQKYKNSSIQSASKEQLLIMMYEGSIKFIKKAIIACENNNIYEKCFNIGKAYDIVLELNNTLDHKVGGEISSQLEQLYTYITEELTKANISGDVKHLNNALNIINTLYQGWIEAINTLKTKESVEEK